MSIGNVFVVPCHSFQALKQQHCAVDYLDDSQWELSLMTWTIIRRTRLNKILFPYMQQCQHRQYFKNHQLCLQVQKNVFSFPIGKSLNLIFILIDAFSIHGSTVCKYQHNYICTISCTYTKINIDTQCLNHIFLHLCYLKFAYALFNVGYLILLVYIYGSPRTSFHLFSWLSLSVCSYFCLL